MLKDKLLPGVLLDSDLGGLRANQIEPYSTTAESAAMQLADGAGCSAQVSAHFPTTMLT